MGDTLSEKDVLLFDAIAASDPQAVRRAISAGADVEAISSGGQTPLMAAITTGNKNVVRALLNAGADPNHETSPTYHPLALAAKLDSDVLRWLAVMGAKRNRRNPSFRCLLTMALMLHDLVPMLRSGG